MTQWNTSGKKNINFADAYDITNDAIKVVGSSAAPFELQISQGLIPEAFVDVKFGTNPDASNVWEVLRLAGALVPYVSADLSGALQVSISSDSANDTVGGTGAHKMSIAGLDINGDRITEIKDLNGLTPVLTTNLFSRVFRVFTVEAEPDVVDNRGGAIDGMVYVGFGTVTGGVPANIMMVAENGQNQSQGCFLTVPAGFTAYIKTLAATTVKDKEYEFGIFARDTQAINSPFRMKANTSLYRCAFEQEAGWYKIEELTDVEMRCRNVTSGNDLVTGTMIVYYFKNEVD